MARLKPTSPAFTPLPDDQRESQRLTLLLRAGKLITADGEYLCLLRDVSAGGVKLRLFHPLTLQGDCAVELSSGARLALAPVWQEGELVGLRFAKGPVEVGALLEDAGPFPKRTIRLRLHRPCLVAIHEPDRTLTGALCDISQHGAALLCEERIAIGTALELAAEPIGAIAARVRWRRGNRYGVVFTQSFRLDELARFADHLQHPAKAEQIGKIAGRVNH